MADAPVTWLAIREDQKAFEDQQLRALRAAFPDLAEASPAQLGIFFHYCKASGLDPFGRQIYMIKRKSRGEIRWTIQTGIDGYRLIARRAADRTGQDIHYEDFTWYDADGDTHDVWLREEPPAACKAVIWRGSARFSAVAHWREYAPKVWDYQAGEYKLGGLWPQMPANQLSKVAEALALRRACPADLSGLSVDEELHAVDVNEARERVHARASDLRASQLRGETPRQDRSSDPSSGVVEVDVVEVSGAGSRSDSEEPQRSEEPIPANPGAELNAARKDVQQMSEQLGMDFDAINERCFAAFGVSFQDTTPGQLQDLTAVIAAVAAFEAEEGQPQPTSAVQSSGEPKGAKPLTPSATEKPAGKKTAGKSTVRDKGTTSPTT